MSYFVYVLQSKKDGLWYTGYTKDVENRLKSHNSGQVLSTKGRIPFDLIYWECCLNQQDATRREKYLKSGNGKNYLKNRLKHYFENPTG